MAGHGEVVFLHGEADSALRRREVGRGDCGVASGAGEVVDPQCLVGAALRGAVVGRAGAHEQIFGLAEEQHGALRGGAREVADVGGAGDQRGGAAAGLAAVPQPGAAGGVHL